MDDVKLDWSSAEVRDGTLQVGLQGELPREWKDSFERTVALLRGGNWGKVDLKKNRVCVEEVGESDESRLHHFLESVVLQANAVFEEEEHEAPDDENEDEPDGPDAEMTKRFRSFATDSATDSDEPA